MKRVAVIGAGVSGMSQLLAFKSEADAGKEIPEVVCFEKQEDWGGLWRYSWRTGVDQYGDPNHSSMYRHLWSNGPKECLEFPQYTFEKHFGKVVPSYPPREVLYDYLVGLFKSANVRNWIRFNSPVSTVTWSEATKKFTISVHDRTRNALYSEEFDYVVVATGHFSTPNVPYFEGIENYTGRVLHSHDFREAREFKDKDVLVVGSSYSAEDIASQCWKFGAKSITLSYRTSPTGYKWPEGFDERPVLIKTEGKTCHLKDGTSKEFDAIVLCTGYQHYFPFLDDALRLCATNRYWIPSLYKGIVFHANPNIMYLGMQDQLYTFTMFTAQAWWARDVILGRIKLPSLEEMKADEATRVSQEQKIESLRDEADFQGGYVKELINETDHPKIDTEAVNKEFVDWKAYKKQSIMGYRDHAHRSIVTGSQSSLHSAKWVDAYDDSLEAFVN